jgi:hypothetical protein
MKTAYRSLVRVKLRHGFYASGESVIDFRVEPNAETAQRLSDFALVPRRTPDGVALYAEIEPDGNPPRLRRPLGRKPLRLQLLLLTQSPYLGNISSLPEHRPGRSLFYFNNLRDDRTSGRLHLGDSVAGQRVGTAISLIASDTHSYRFPTEVEAAVLTLKDIFGNPMATIPARFPEPVSEHRVELGDIEGLVPGRYLLSDDHGGSESFFYDPALGSRRPLAVIEIFSTTEALTPDQTNRVPAAYRFLDGEELTSVGDYVLQLEPRSTTWRYNVIKKYTSNTVTLAGLTITGPVGFTKSLESDRAVFTSSADVALSETERALVLMHSGTKICALPNPSAATSLQEGTSAGALVSEMYVYV